MAKKRTPPEKSAPKATGPTFENLVLSIRGVDQKLAAQASRAVNVSLTLRNWLIGCYIAEYELRRGPGPLRRKAASVPSTFD